MLQKIFSQYSPHLDGLFCMHSTLETAADGLFSSFLLPRTLSNLLQLSEEQHLPWVNAEKNNNYDGSDPVTGIQDWGRVEDSWDSAHFVRGFTPQHIQENWILVETKARRRI